MPKTFNGEHLPLVAARQGNPDGVPADDDVVFKDQVVVTKGEFYSRAYLDEIAAGCAQAKPRPGANKSLTPTENK